MKLNFYSRISLTDERKKLYLRNPIRLDDVPIDDLNAIVFVLEYMVSIPLRAPSKPVLNDKIYFLMTIDIIIIQNEPVQSTKLTYTIRWAAWFPGKDKQVALIMSGGEMLPTDELFVYKPSKTVLNNTPAVVQETLRFNYRFDTDVRKREFSSL